MQTYRPQLARSALEQRVVHCKRQARLAFPAARRHDTTRAQRVVEVGRVHLRALVRRACAQPRQRVDRTTPRLHQRAVAGTVLQASRVKTVVERSNVHRTSRRTQRRVVLKAGATFADHLAGDLLPALLNVSGEHVLTAEACFRRGARDRYIGCRAWSSTTARPSASGTASRPTRRGRLGTGATRGSRSSRARRTPR